MPATTPLRDAITLRFSFSDSFADILRYYYAALHDAIFCLLYTLPCHYRYALYYARFHAGGCALLPVAMLR